MAPKIFSGIFMTLACGGAFLILASCSIFPDPVYSKTEYFDLGTPKRSGAKNISVMPFSSSSGERYKMAFKDGNLVTSDDSSKWLMPPGSLMTKYLRLAFRGDGTPVFPAASVPVVVSGTVTAFEAEKGEALLGLMYRIVFTDGKTERKKTMVRSLLVREKIAGNTPAAFAEAMTRAAAKAADTIAADVGK